MMNETLTLLSPAKINLFLHILGRRSDGYHELQTAFQLVDFCDQIEFHLREDGLLQIYSTNSSIQLHENLIYRAATRMMMHSEEKLGADIFLNKKLPLGAGLGGGSSNAATTLLGLNRLWHLGFSLDELADIGRELGADVPVFVRGFSAWGEGVGENLIPIEFPEKWYLILVPPYQVSTSKIFSHADLPRSTPPITFAEFRAQPHLARNDCEPLVRRLYPQVDAAFEWLKQFGRPRLTGTGSCVFVELTDQQKAQRAAQRAPKPFTAIVARGINRSPAHHDLYDIEEQDAWQQGALEF